MSVGAIVAAWRDTLVHRGPDADGAVPRRRDRRAGLGFRRLRIIDLTRQRQSADAERGRVDSARLQRRDLQLPRAARASSRAAAIASARAPTPRSSSTSTKTKGADAIEQLDGMFALAIWDERAAPAAARARSGGQEAALLLRRLARQRRLRVRDQGVAWRIRTSATRSTRARFPYFFIYGYVPASADAVSRRARRSPPATVLTIARDGRAPARRYWTLSAAATPRSGRGPSTDARRRRRVRDLLTRGRRAAAGQRRAARRVPERRRRFDDRRRADEPADARTGQDVQHRVRGRSRVRRNVVRAAWWRERFQTDHTEFHVTPSARRPDRHADLASRRAVRRLVGDPDLHRVAS